VTTIAFVAAAGRLDWAWAWVYVGGNLANVLVVGPIAIQTNPSIVAQHNASENMQKWDTGSVFHLLAAYIALPLVAGLDVRFGWARNLSIAWHAAGTLAFVVGLGLVSWVMIANPYTWSEVPVQRGQTVCSTGPYRLVRHPAYAGLVLQALGVPILLGSFWALMPGIAAAVCIVIATSSEDGMLQVELPGYQDYVRKVRYRLVPGIW